MHAFIVLLLVAFFFPIQAQDKNGPPGTWTGKWRGTLVNLPARPGAPVIDVLLEIGPLPAANKTCATWRNTYSEAGVTKQVKDYKLCRGESADDLYLDEGGNVRLAARWMDDVLLIPFKYDKQLLISSTRLRGDTLEEEIMVIDDTDTSKGIQSLRPRSIQRLTYRREK